MPKTISQKLASATKTLKQQDKDIRAAVHYINVLKQERETLKVKLAVTESMVGCLQVMIDGGEPKQEYITEVVIEDFTGFLKNYTSMGGTEIKDGIMKLRYVKKESLQPTE